MKTSSAVGMTSMLNPSLDTGRIRGLAALLAIAGLLFVIYPALRPFSDESSLEGAAAFASSEWLLSHTLAIFGFILLPLGLLGLLIVFNDSKAKHLMFQSLVLALVGTGLTLPFYGAEVYGLYAIGQEALRLQNAEFVQVANEVRFGSGFIMIVIGLILLAISLIMAAISIWRTGILSKASGIPLALGMLLYLPQYMASQPLRVAHGALMTLGCVWIAIELWNHSKRSGR